MPENSPIWRCPPRTKAKLEILRNYLGAWFGILATNGYRHVYYIDGFCGPGEYLDGEEGSPVIAARLASSTAQKYPGFHATLIYVDNNPKAIEHLKSTSAIRTQHPNVKVNIMEGIFSDQVEYIVSTLKENPNSPTFSFIDPFGFGHSPLDKLSLLMHNQSSEIFVNFMCGFMNRFKEHDDEEVTAKIKNMVGEEDLTKIIMSDDSIDAFCLSFEENLREIGPYTLKFIMRDEHNIRDNAFFFSGRHPRGFEKIKQAMWKVDPIRGNSFSAHRETARDHLQSDFFARNAYTHPLFGLIASKFSGCANVSIEKIFKWVVEKTDTYLEIHARAELENLLVRGVIISIVDPSGSRRKRRKYAWPKRLLVTFAEYPTFPS